MKMEEIIKISTNDSGDPTVSCRELYAFLGATERFSNWFERMCQYGFVENTDYVGCKVFNTLANQELTDYALTTDMAKEISMLQRNEKGKIARGYFIEAEKRLKPKSGLELVMDAMKFLQSELEKKDDILKKTVPKAEYLDRIISSDSSFTTTSLAKELGMSAVKLNRLLHAHGIQYKVDGQWVLYEKHCRKGYEKYRVIEKNGKTFRSLEWTEYGRSFVHNLINPIKKNEPTKLPLYDTKVISIAK